MEKLMAEFIVQFVEMARVIARFDGAQAGLDSLTEHMSGLATAVVEDRLAEFFEHHDVSLPE
jgi:hypothetical protein